VATAVVDDASEVIVAVVVETVTGVVEALDATEEVAVTD
jgi:hypothetical protein